MKQQVFTATGDTFPFELRPEKRGKKVTFTMEEIVGKVRMVNRNSETEQKCPYACIENQVHVA